MVKIQKPIPKKLEKKPKLDNPIKQKKNQLKKEKSSTKNAKLLDDSTPVKEAKVALKTGKKPNKKDLNGEKKIDKKPLIIAPESSPEQKKEKKKNKNKTQNVVKNGVEAAPKVVAEIPAKISKKLAKNGEETAPKVVAEIPAKANKKDKVSEKPAKLGKKDKKQAKNEVEKAAKSAESIEPKKKDVVPPPAAKPGKNKNNKKTPSLPTAPVTTPSIEKIKKVKKPKAALQQKKIAKIAFKKGQLAAKGESPKVKAQAPATPFRYDPIPYDEERFNSIVNAENIIKVAEALKTTVEKEVKTKKSSIFDDYRYFLQVGSFKIPSCPKRMVRLNLKHSLVDKDDDVLLFVPDLQRGAKVDYEATKHHYEDWLKGLGVEGITVMPMNQLRKEYGTFEQKRKLCASYEYFLSDGRIMAHVGGIIGKFTNKPRNTLQSVRLNDNKNVKAEIEKSLKKTAYRQLAKGSLQTIPVGSHKFSAKQLADNILLVVEQLKQGFPGGLGNVRTLHLRIGLTGTSSLPLYISMGQAPDETPTVLGPREERMVKLKREANEVLSKFTMTKDGKLVKLTKSGVEKKRKLQEMAASLKEGENQDEVAAKKGKKTKKESAKGEKTSKKKVKEVKELELPENEEEDDDTSDEDDEDAAQLGQGSDDEETEDDEMANLDEEDTESGAEIVENGFVGEDDEESDEDDDQEVDQGENDDDDEDDEDEDEDDEEDDEEEESD
ncbi:ribosomal L1 domain-containing protein CG13096 [Episyrphus balteatus]|uniref:ribosomal L1 domain-containing protein CG13096 n=1 Tax=Episyrphus balteatus TaxID=286459 RepID=UPI002485DB98|nr:ribosomal L1 domain-containing protein CG13096 [Episyrphus balteatus]